jgi:hypothetical protein
VCIWFSARQAVCHVLNGCDVYISDRENQFHDALQLSYAYHVGCLRAQSVLYETKR